MSWSLQLSHGDLTWGHGLNTVTGPQKLVQDLRCALLERMGTDNLHSSYGSVIDGGIDPQGNIQPGLIGQPNNPDAATFVDAELRRIAANYQAQQVARNNADVAVYGKSTLTADEALLGLNNVQIIQAQTQILVTATLQTGAGAVPLTLPLSTT